MLLIRTHRYQLRQDSATLGIRAPTAVTPKPKFFSHFQYCQPGASGTQCVNILEYYLRLIATSTTWLLQPQRYRLLLTHTHTPLSLRMHVYIMVAGLG